ncbi:hypothetical protein [Magnetospirillum sp. 15-1]|uniref:hypothetical protein n=1 Tax=Magnetospirillum sp. 15-1 TaxID=1979370 RepID=UPI000BBCA0F6|nr:hypothetical protein [Magnetospirillum sp. 15-1]
MRDVLSRLFRLGLPALLLVVGLAVWSGAAQAGEAMHHQHDGASAEHAMPCHDDATPAAKPKAADHGCPDCRCLFTGCAAAAATLPGMTGEAPVTFTLAPPQAAQPVRLVTQALSGPPAEPPRL